MDKLVQDLRNAKSAILKHVGLGDDCLGYLLLDKTSLKWQIKGNDVVMNEKVFDPGKHSCFVRFPICNSHPLGMGQLCNNYIFRGYRLVLIAIERPSGGTCLAIFDSSKEQLFL